MGCLPVDGDIVSCMVDDLDKNIIALPCIKGWSWELAIHSEDGLGRAKPCHVPHNHLYKKSNHAISEMICRCLAGDMLSCFCYGGNFLVLINLKLCNMEWLDYCRKFLQYQQRSPVPSVAVNWLMTIACEVT